MINVVTGITCARRRLRRKGSLPRKENRLMLYAAMLEATRTMATVDTAMTTVLSRYRGMADAFQTAT